MMYKLLITLILATTSTVAYSNTIYKCTINGSIKFQNFPCSTKNVNMKEQKMKVKPNAQVPFKEETNRLKKQYGLDKPEQKEELNEDDEQLLTEAMDSKDSGKSEAALGKLLKQLMKSSGEKEPGSQDMNMLIQQIMKNNPKNQKQRTDDIDRQLEQILGK